jgi:hypothetical protein
MDVRSISTLSNVDFAGAVAVTLCVEFAAPQIQMAINAGTHAREILLCRSSGE